MIPVSILPEFERCKEEATHVYSRAFIGSKFRTQQRPPSIQRAEQFSAFACICLSDFCLPKVYSTSVTGTWQCQRYILRE